MRRAASAGIIGAAVAAGLAASVVGAGAVNAETRSEYVGMNCYGLNPNIVDIPYYGGVTVWTDSPWPGQFTIIGDSKSLFPYTTDTTVTVKELATGKTTTAHRRWGHGLGDASGYSISGLRGHGRVRITVRAVNHGLIPNLPAPVCRGVATV
ncbi:hypothetical protein [Gordonia shandongensis]|uniref:hypothetical protein n=1 Tax=Gordonia shandongensis TaxID=376351 RepID=UPI0004200091|nr:hypothetical protein [Gordonia shandongensis]